MTGLLQAPQTPHVFEAKAVNPEKFKKFVDLRGKVGEKQILMNWDYVYFVQAQVYLGLLDLKRHYLVVATPGGREMASCRTEFVPVHFAALMKKAERIIAAKDPPARLMDDPSYWQCKWCRFREHCTHAMTRIIPNPTPEEKRTWGPLAPRLEGPNASGSSTCPLGRRKQVPGEPRPRAEGRVEEAAGAVNEAPVSTRPTCLQAVYHYFRVEGGEPAPGRADRRGQEP